MQDSPIRIVLTSVELVLIHKTDQQLPLLFLVAVASLVDKRSFRISQWRFRRIFLDPGYHSHLVTNCIARTIQRKLTAG